MLQRRAQGATRKSLAGKKSRCKLFYTTAQAVEQSTKDGVNAFISEDISNPEIRSLSQEDAVARGVYLARSLGFVVEKLLIPDQMRIPNCIQGCRKSPSRTT
jgi:hypothetical protein